MDNPSTFDRGWHLEKNEPEAKETIHVTQELVKQESPHFVTDQSQIHEESTPPVAERVL